jgi:hypothetical protein
MLNVEKRIRRIRSYLRDIWRGCVGVCGARAAKGTLGPSVTDFRVIPWYVPIVSILKPSVSVKDITILVSMKTTRKILSKSNIYCIKPSFCLMNLSWSYLLYCVCWAGIFVGSGITTGWGLGAPGLPSSRAFILPNSAKILLANICNTMLLVIKFNTVLQ